METAAKKSTLPEKISHEYIFPKLNGPGMARNASDGNLAEEAVPKLPGNESTGSATRSSTGDKEITSNNNQQQNQLKNFRNPMMKAGISDADEAEEFSEATTAAGNVSAASTTTASSKHHDPVQNLHSNEAGPTQITIASKSKQKPLAPSEHDSSLETQLLCDLATTMSMADRQAIYKQCQAVLAKISDKGQVLSMEEVLQIVQDWKPKQEILCLYVRIARKLPANFHLDSISTLLCLSKQCGYTPVNFLTKTKCLQITPSGGRYCSSFMFTTISNKTVDGDNLDRKFVGLSLTLTLLEHSVSHSCGVISRGGMRSSAPREPVNKALDLGGSSKISFKTMPSNEFHKRSSLINRLWLAINHRWMSYHLVEHLFVCQDNLCEKDAILVYSFMMHASCGKSRYQYLGPMAGICFRFLTRDDIEANRDRLNDLWKNPSNFVVFGNYCLQRDNTEKKIRILVDTFTSMTKLFTRKTSYGRAIDNERRWLMLRAYIFSFWLKRESNNEIRYQVESVLASSPISTSRKSRTIANKPCKHSHEKIQNHLKDAPDHACKRRRLESTSSQSRLWSRVVNCSQKSAATNLPTKQAATSLIDGTTEHAEEQQDSSLVFPTISTKAMLLEKDWSSMQLLTQAALDEVAASYLLVHTDGGLDILSKLSPLEVYSADRLNEFRHSRVCGPPGYQPHQQLGDVVLRIGSGSDEYLDKYSKLIHVVRQGSAYFKEHKKILPSDQMFANLCKSILKYGNIDGARSMCQYRVNIGCGGQHFPKGVPATLIGKGFAKKLDNDNEFDSEEILSTIGHLVEFLWCVAQDIQRDVCDAPLAPDPLRRNAYAKHLCRYLFIEQDVGFEDITLVMSPITSTELDVVSEHTDIMNDSVGGYSRTCAFNACFSLGQDAVMHMQVIGNFRRTIRQYLVPFEKSLQSTIENGKRYLALWRSNMQLVFAGVSPNQMWNPFDRSQLFLDDDLPFEQLEIFNGAKKSNKPQKSVYGYYLLTEIGLSRVTSFSMFIDPICKLKDRLSTDQRIELVFFCSLLSNPFWFHYIMEKLIAQSNQPNHPFSFGIHPMYDVIEELFSTFGTWQGGPHNRWSPCGGAVPVVQLFGAIPSATDQEKRLGMEKLEAIVEVLFCHLEWVNSLMGKGLDPLNDLPMSTIQFQWETIRKQIHDIIPCQFSLFRLSVFTTIVIGCNELLPGPHLKQIMIPLPGTSSFKHLLTPSKGQISKQSAMDLAKNTKEVVIKPNEDDQVTADNHDRLMLYLSNSFGRKQYVRDEIECLLCESHPGRSLECRDWFCKGQNIFDCSDDGNILIRSYGKESEWTPIGKSQSWSFKFLKTRCLAQYEVDHSVAPYVYYKVDESIARCADSLGIELRQFKERIVFNGRKGTKSNQQSEHYDNPFLRRSAAGGNYLHVHHYRSANLFSRQFCSITNKQKMVVLGNGEQPKNLLYECNDFASFSHGMTLLEKVRETLHLSCGMDEEYKFMVAACYHQEMGDGLDKITYFPGHLDKCYIDNVWFVPLSRRQFFTFVAVPSSWNIQQDVDSNQEYQLWLCEIGNDEQKSVLEFHDLFQRDACKFMKVTSVTSLVFSNKLGSVLQFPANRCFHATIIPAAGKTMTTTKSYRDLLIFHPLLTL